MLELNKIYNMDCIEWMKLIPDWSIDCIITDPPYWTTVCKRDTIIPFDLMREQLKRIIKTLMELLYYLEVNHLVVHWEWAI